MRRNIIYKGLIIILLFGLLQPVLTRADDAPAPVSPVRAALEQARELVRAGDRDEAVSVLQSLADGGFTAVGVIEGDAVLSTLTGDPSFDSLVMVRVSVQGVLGGVPGRGT